jgi:hypothetical protein
MSNELMNEQEQRKEQGRAEEKVDEEDRPMFSVAGKC